VWVHSTCKEIPLKTFQHLSHSLVLMPDFYWNIPNVVKIDEMLHDVDTTLQYSISSYVASSVY
jgi:hypothetical protein